MESSGYKTVKASVDVDIAFNSSESPGRKSIKSREGRDDCISKQLEDKQREIDRLHVLIETIRPVPGYDHEAMRKACLEKGGENGLDHRDSKIVSLAKKIRGLTVETNKLSAENENLQQAVRDSNQMCNSLREELALAKANNRSTPSESSIADLTKELANSNKQIEELRRKYLQAKEESKNYKSALSRELGEDVTIEQALNGNWRGRAQTIVMLKSKIRRLEAQLEKPEAASGVDAKADRNIASMDNERKQAIEAITEDYKRISEENADLEAKYASCRARIKTLEADYQRIKQQMQIVLDKTSSDDDLIEALKSEVERLKQLIRDMKISAKQESGESKKQVSLQSNGLLSETLKGNMTSSATDEVNRRLTNEITRLERICKSQTQQLSTQDTVIRELRAEISRLG